MPAAKKPLGKAADVKTKPARPGRGGPRAGAGRPAGAAAERSKSAANRLAQGMTYIEAHGEPEELHPDATPLDVMLMAMRVAYRLHGARAAHEYARDCAPYIHARIAQMELKNSEGQVFNVSFRWQGEEL